MPIRSSMPSCKSIMKSTGEYGGLVTGVVDKLVEGYPLISDANSTNTMYGSAYTQLFVDGNSSESIFELTYMDNDNMLSNEAVSHGYGNEETFPGFFPSCRFHRNGYSGPFLPDL